MAKKIVRADDGQILTAFKKLCAELKATPASVNLALEAEPGSSLQIDLETINDNAVAAPLLAGGLTIVRTFKLQMPSIGANVTVQRSEPFDQMSVHFEAKQPKNQVATQEQQVSILSALDRQFFSFVPKPIPSSLGPELADFYQSRDETVVRLERLNEQITVRNDEYRTKLQAEADAMRKQLDEAHAARREQLENEHEARRSALEQEFEQKNAELESRSKTLDDRSARHARREQFQQLKALLQNRNTSFVLTKDTVRKRGPIHLLFVFLLFALTGLVAVLAYKQLWLGAQDPYFGLRLPVAVAGLVAAVIYYIRWNDAWFLRHADEEFRLKRFDLDMDRAGWLVELAIEAHESGEEAIPEDLLRRLSSNIFGADEKSREVAHPADDIRNALLETAGGLEVNVPGLGRVFFNQRQLKKLQRQVRQGQIKLIDEKD